jgi:hypothetical protein
MLEIILSCIAEVELNPSLEDVNATLELRRREMRDPTNDRTLRAQLNRRARGLRWSHGRNSQCYPCGLEGSGRQLIGGTVPVKKRGPWAHANLRVVTPFRRRSRLGR